MTDIATIRLLISDRQSTFFTDDELQAFLDLESSDVRMAAAQALDAMAADASQVAKAVSSGTFSQDLKSIPVQLAARADTLRKQVANEPYSAVYDPGVFPWMAADTTGTDT
jgi:hypothetical protein